MSSKSWKLSPSDFAFLWEECKCCFYLKTVKGFQRPRPIMPKIFTSIDSEMKKYYSGMRTETINSNFPPGVVQYSEKWVESQPVTFENRLSSCFIRGKFDTVAKFDDGTYGVIDFKTSERKAEHIPLYSRQLHAYVHALEKPAQGNLHLTPISRLGLLVFEPSRYTQGKTDNVGFAGKISWIEVPRNDSSFYAFLDEVLTVLEAPSPPAPNPKCEWCQYRDKSRDTGF